MAVGIYFLMGCAVLLVVGCAGTRSEAPQEKQGQAEVTKQEQTRSPEATASEEARCEGTRTYYSYLDTSTASYGTGSEEDMKKAGKVVAVSVHTTNDLPGCPKGGLLLGTEGSDHTRFRDPARPGLDGGDGDDVIRGLGGSDSISGGDGKDVLYGGPGEDNIAGVKGEDVIYGGDGNDFLDGSFDGGDRDKLYCGEGRDEYIAGKNDYVDSSCEKEDPGPHLDRGIDVL